MLQNGEKQAVKILIRSRLPANILLIGHTAGFTKEMKRKKQVSVNDRQDFRISRTLDVMGEEITRKEQALLKCLLGQYDKMFEVV